MIQIFPVPDFSTILSEQLTLTFDDIVNVATLMTQFIRLRSDIEGTDATTFINSPVEIPAASLDT